MLVVDGVLLLSRDIAGTDGVGFIELKPWTGGPMTLRLAHAGSVSGIVLVQGTLTTMNIEVCGHFHAIIALPMNGLRRNDDEERTNVDYKKN